MRIISLQPSHPLWDTARSIAHTTRHCHHTAPFTMGNIGPIVHPRIRRGLWGLCLHGPFKHGGDQPTFMSYQTHICDRIWVGNHEIPMMFYVSAIKSRQSPSNCSQCSVWCAVRSLAHFMKLNWKVMFINVSVSDGGVLIKYFMTQCIKLKQISEELFPLIATMLSFQFWVRHLDVSTNQGNKNYIRIMNISLSLFRSSKTLMCGWKSLSWFLIYLL